MPKRILVGTVVSDKTDKTVVVKVERKVKHALYGKIMRRSKKYHAHDEDNTFKAGETVRIEETRPISKLKTWKVLDRVTASKTAAALPASTRSTTFHVFSLEIGAVSSIRTVSPALNALSSSCARSEERRVGKECVP